MPLALAPQCPSCCQWSQRVIEILSSSGSKAVLLNQLLPPQIRVRSTPDSRHDSNGPEHLRLVPTTEIGRRSNPFNQSV
jgi:hypothetical protein